MERTTEATLDLTEVTTANFSTTARGDQIADEFVRRLNQRKNGVARLAMARSLAVPAPPDAVAEGTLGKEIRGVNLFGNELRTWLALFFEHAPVDAPSLAQLQDLARRHWTRGLHLLEEDWARAGENYDAFVRRSSASLASATRLPFKRSSAS